MKPGTMKCQNMALSVVSERVSYISAIGDSQSQNSECVKHMSNAVQQGYQLYGKLSSDCDVQESTERSFDWWTWDGRSRAHRTAMMTGWSWACWRRLDLFSHLYLSARFLRFHIWPSQAFSNPHNEKDPQGFDRAFWIFIGWNLGIMSLLNSSSISYRYAT